MRLNIFAALKDITSGKLNEPPRHPYHLSAEQVDGVRAVRSSEGWPSYMALINNASNLYGETLLRTDDDAQLHYLRGYIAGLRASVTLVEQTIQRDEHGRKIHEQRSIDASERRERRRRAVLYGTPGWRSDAPSYEPSSVGG